jgi:tRNA A37 methylthiotransferase MiaB
LKAIRRNRICSGKVGSKVRRRKSTGYILINDAPEELKPQIGEFYNVKITEAHNYDLIGEIV